MDPSFNMLTDQLTEFGMHHETQQRSLSVPSPPKIWIPPAPLDETGLPDLSYVQRKRPAEFEASGFPDTDFLQYVSYEGLQRRDAGHNWRYEERREAQEILPFLFLGPDMAARNRDFLVQKGITLCIAVRNSETAKAKLITPRAPGDLGIPIINIDVMDNPQLIAEFSRAVDLINSHLNSRHLQYTRTHPGSDVPSPPGRILIFCETGNERSAAVVAAYIMAVYSVNLEKAVQLVQASRFCVALDYQLAHLLRSYESILQAKRDVYIAVAPSVEEGGSATPHALENITFSAKKRGLDETRDDDMEWLGTEMDAARFDRRPSPAPFADDDEDER
jgi:serine/threonine/tyrosine-interacting protein